MLLKLSPQDVPLNKPTSFAIYGEGGQLLLQKGNLVASEGVRERLLRMGYREGPGPGGKSETARAVRPSRPAPPAEPFLISTLKRPPENEGGAGELAPSKVATLPNLAQKVEFFHISTAGAEETQPVELIGVIPEQALIVRCPAEASDTSWLVADVGYEARLFTGSRLFKFTTRLLPEAVGPLGCYFLQYPEVVAQAAVRKQQRISTLVPGKVSVSDFKPPIDVVVENVSVIGAGISTKEVCLTTGQSVRLSMNLKVEQRVRSVLVPAVVRNCRRDGARFIYGLEFSRAPDVVRQDIKDFVLDSLALL